MPQPRVGLDDQTRAASATHGWAGRGCKKKNHAGYPRGYDHQARRAKAAPGSQLGARHGAVQRCRCRRGCWRSSSKHEDQPPSVMQALAADARAVNRKLEETAHSRQEPTPAASSTPTNSRR